MKLSAYRVQVTDTTTNTVQPDAILSDFRIANQSCFTSDGTGAPASMAQAAVQAYDYLSNVSLAAGTSVQMSVVGGVGAPGNYDVSAWIATDPMPPNTAPGFVLSDIALIFPLNAAALAAPVGSTVVMTATCNRVCTLGKLFLSASAPTISVISLLVAGEEQLAQSTTVGIGVEAFGPLATMENSDMDLLKQISPGESVQITLQNNAIGVQNVLGGIYCI